MKIGGIYRNNHTELESYFIPLEANSKYYKGVIMTHVGNEWYTFGAAEFYDAEMRGDEPRFEAVGSWQMFNKATECCSPDERRISYSASVTKPSILSPYWIYKCPNCGNAFRVPKHDRVFVNYCVDCGYKLWRENGDD